MQPDGSLGPFAILTDVALSTGRLSGGVVVAGKFVYAIGGFYGGETSIERASINPDGSLGTFSIVSGVSLTMAHEDFTVAVLGHFLYVLGGQNAGESGALTAIERISLGSDGSLQGTFSVSNNFKLARNGVNIAIVGNQLYALNGESTATVERATINPDGSLGVFSTVPTLTVPASFGPTGVVTTGNTLYACTGPVCTPLSLP